MTEIVKPEAPRPHVPTPAPEPVEVRSHAKVVVDGEELDAPPGLDLRDKRWHEKWPAAKIKEFWSAHDARVEAAEMRAAAEADERTDAEKRADVLKAAKAPGPRVTLVAALGPPRVVVRRCPACGRGRSGVLRTWVWSAAPGSEVRRASRVLFHGCAHDDRGRVRPSRVVRDAPVVAGTPRRPAA